MAVVVTPCLWAVFRLCSSVVSTPPLMTAFGAVATPSPSKGVDEALPGRWESSISVTQLAATASPSRPFSRERPRWALSAENRPEKVASSEPATSLRNSVL